MTLEFEKLTTAVSDMARHASQRKQEQQEQLEAAMTKLRLHATAWEHIDACLDRAVQEADEKFYRAARPLFHHYPLDQPIPAPPCPEKAVLIAADGSQIVPDRHAAYTYYLINVGGIVYHHGYGISPTTFTEPVLNYPRSDETAEDDPFEVSASLVSIRRDRAEIEMLAKKAWEYRSVTCPLLAIVDQRLLYWPTGGSGGEGQRVVEGWQAAMTKVRDSGGWLAGYIDRSGKRSVLTMLYTLQINEPGFDLKTIHKIEPYADLTDTALFGRVLQQPGERTAVFFDISQHNRAFKERDALNEICFFYLRTGYETDQIARVDIPLWVAIDETAVSAVHALIYDQCQIIGRYPYIITRADEIAVVTHREQEELDFRIGLKMSAYGLDGHITAKQLSKDLARSGKTRFEGV